MKKQFFLFVLLLIPLFHLNGQENIKVHRQQEWFQYYNQAQLAPKFTLASDGGFRIQNNPLQLSTLLLRTGLSYNFNPNISIGIGFAYFTSFKDNKLIKSEYRPFQEFQLKNSFCSGNLQHRIRIEERSFHSELSNLNTFNFRFRYRLYFTYPIAKFDSGGKSLFVIAADEVFLNCGKEITYNFDQNRIIAGIGFSFTKDFQLSLSYVHQYAQKNLPDTFEITDILWLGATHKIGNKEKLK